jgi:oxaloacetate decarboxylase alpha subunit
MMYQTIFLQERNYFKTYFTIRAACQQQETADARLVGHAAKVQAVPKLVDTTIRLLSQEPLAGALPTGEVLRVAEILDQAGFACMEVSGGGVFDATVRRRVESPWERIRAIRARVSTPLGIALRGRFLVGSRPVSGDIVGRFVSCAAENGIEVFRLHDPLNDVSNLREAGAAITNAGGAFHAGLVYSPGRTGETDTIVEQARKLPELGATRVIVNDPTGALVPHRAQELVGRIREASELPVGFYVQGSAGVGLASALAAVEAGADLVATAVYPLALALHRVSGESLAESLEGLGYPTGLDGVKLWDAADVIDEFIGDEPVAPVAPRIAVRAAEYDLPAGLVAALEVHLRAHNAADRLLEVLEEVGRVRAEAGWPPLAAPIGQILASQALLHVLEARRYGTVIDEFRELVQGGYGVTPQPIDTTVERAVELLAPRSLPAEDPVTTEDVREQAEGLAASEEELVLIAMFDTDAEELLRMIRARHSRDASLIAEDADAERGERIRELVKIVQESGVGEIEIEDEGMRVSVRRADEPAPTTLAAAPSPGDADVVVASVEPRTDDGAVRVESPMVGVFYRAPNPGAPAFVDVGDTVFPGQTLCILEAMKLFNELKAEAAGTIRSIHVENAQPVEFGQLLFEIDPILVPPAV